jgi:hypothetical protein
MFGIETKQEAIETAGLWARRVRVIEECADG